MSISYSTIPALSVLSAPVCWLIFKLISIHRNILRITLFYSFTSRLVTKLIKEAAIVEGMFFYVENTVPYVEFKKIKIMTHVSLFFFSFFFFFHYGKYIEMKKIGKDLV